jgi:hypothetical protein
LGPRLGGDDGGLNLTRSTRFTKRRRWLAAGTLFAACMIVIASIVVAEALRTSTAITRIAIEATPVLSFDNRDPTRVRFGELEFRGGLSLSSDYKAFGGLSALHIDADGANFLSLSDNGSWLRGRIVYRDDRPVGIADAEMAPILGWDGKPLAAHRWFDAESLTELDGQFYIGIERVEKIVRFDYRARGLAARGEPIKVPDDFKSFTYNKSLECLAGGLPGTPLAGTLIVVTEHSLDSAGNHRSYLLKGDEVSRFTVARSDDYDVSDCAILPPSDLLLLERRLSITQGLGMRIRRIPLDELKAGAVADGPVMIEADLGFQIDNMEGIAVHQNAAGETIITLISDDNFSVIQRNLLLQFAVVRE